MTWLPMDPWLSFREATDRAHRIGQKRTVFVHFLISKAGACRDAGLDMPWWAVQIQIWSDCGACDFVKHRVTVFRDHPARTPLRRGWPKFWSRNNSSAIWWCSIVPWQIRWWVFGSFWPWKLVGRKCHMSDQHAVLESVSKARIEAVHIAIVFWASWNSFLRYLFEVRNTIVPMFSPSLPTHANDWKLRWEIYYRHGQWRTPQVFFVEILKIRAATTVVHFHQCREVYAGLHTGINKSAAKLLVWCFCCVQPIVW